MSVFLIMLMLLLVIIIDGGNDDDYENVNRAGIHDLQST